MENKKTILSLETPYGEKFIAELPWDCSTEKLIDTFIGLCVSATYPYNNVIKTMNEMTNELLD